MSDKEESIPSEFMHILLEANNQLKVWREYRGLSIDELADKSGIECYIIENIEASIIRRADKNTQKLADALNLDTDDLIDYDVE